MIIKKSYICGVCGRAHTTPYLALECERGCGKTAAQRVMLAKEHALKLKRAGLVEWVEEGETKTAPRVDPGKHGPHSYSSSEGTSDCQYGCGCWMGSYRSGGPVDPFGACPHNLRVSKKRSKKRMDVSQVR